MNLEEFNLLSDEDKNAFFGLHDKMVDDLKNVEAERDSFKSENAALKTDAIKINSDLKSAKELNFTLARKLSTEEPKKSTEDILHEIFMEGE